ncbi:MAG: hypothetical protein GBAus27B_000208 [Mycoplasmataceae bacterium]|nr:MAG: hypothetical protein GBAus27B_000208 [Mycoplasmataceae bacterium]
MQSKTILKTPIGAVYRASVDSNQTTEKQSIILLDEFEKEKFTKLTGILTSKIWTRESSNTPYYSFFRRNDISKHSLSVCEKIKCQECEIPIIFRLTNSNKPQLEKNNQVILAGQWANSDHSSRPSFTCYSYQLIND